MFAVVPVSTSYVLERDNVPGSSWDFLLRGGCLCAEARVKATQFRNSLLAQSATASKPMISWDKNDLKLGGILFGS